MNDTRADATSATSSLGERLVARITARMPVMSRRSLLYRVAVVGSALMVDPSGYVLRPRSAYASVCGSAASCNDGWSAFCCTINDGANTCPPGSFVAGWWKVGGSAFCRGAARYYIDCNRRPAATCACKCADGSCDKRRTCCNVFRYGQCNQQIAGVTEVVCRIVTCTPPWRWDPACTDTPATAEATRTHSSACLPGTWPSHVEIRYQDLGLAGAVVGAPSGPEHSGPGNGRWRRYDNGVITWHRDLGAHETHGPVATRYLELRGPRGALGYLRGDLRDIDDGPGRRSRCQRGTIYHRRATGAWEVRGRADVRYRKLGGPAGRLGYPIGPDEDVGDGRGHVAELEHGAIYATDRRGIEVTGPILKRYRSLGGPAGDDRLGYPLRPQRDAGRGTAQDFERGTLWWSRGTGAHLLQGAIDTRFRAEDDVQGPLGFPTSDVVRTAAGMQRCAFEGGQIIHDLRTGGTRVLRYAESSR